MHQHPTLPPQRRRSWRLIVLTAVVLLAHWAALRAAPRAFAAHELASNTPTNTWAFTTRTLEELPVPAPQKLAPPQPPAAHNRPRAAALVKTINTTPPPATPAPASDLEQKDAPAPDKYQTTAIEKVASVVEPLVTDPPVLLAAADTAPAETQSPTPTPPPATAKTGAAAAVRNYVYPPAAHLKYEVKGEVKGFPYFVNGELTWAQDGKTYNARMEISHFLLGSRVQTSTGQLTAQGLEPLRFGDKVRSEVAAHFERSKNKVTFSANTPDAPLLPGAQDQLSVLAQLAAMLAGDPKAFPKGSTLLFQAVGPRSSESWTFTVGVSEKLVLPGGELNAIRLWRDPTSEYDTKLEVWMAPDLGYLPARVRLTQANGDFVDQQWRATLNK